MPGVYTLLLFIASGGGTLLKSFQVDYRIEGFLLSLEVSS